MILQLVAGGIAGLSAFFLPKGAVVTRFYFEIVRHPKTEPR